MSPLRRLGLIAAVIGTVVLMSLTANAATATWTVMPDDQSATADGLSAVSCPSVSFCLALGSNGPEPESFQWNGSSWALSARIGQEDESNLNGISCMSATYCLAVGWNFYHGSTAAAWLWNGSSWSNLTAYNPATKWNSLNAVKCVSASYCEAVGSYSKYEGFGQHALAEVWNGSTWTGQPVNGAKGPVPGVLDAVACASASRCEAVGGGLAAGWNGTKWSPQGLPTVNGGQLHGVSCYRTGCTSVGTSSSGTGGTKTLAETWNGARWALQSPVGSGNVTGAVNTIWSAVHCGSASNCTVVGEWDNASNNYTLAETWNGARWALQSPVGSGNVTGAVNTIWNAVHCGSASNCTVVGEWDSASTNNYTLAEAWNGSKWVEDTTPSPGSGGHHLTALSCTPGTQVCTAVGWMGGTGPIFAERN